jgi:hypothetical protein
MLNIFFECLLWIELDTAFLFFSSNFQTNKLSPEVITLLDDKNLIFKWRWRLSELTEDYGINLVENEV